MRDVRDSDLMMDSFGSSDDEREQQVIYDVDDMGDDVNESDGISTREADDLCGNDDSVADLTNSRRKSAVNPKVGLRNSTLTKGLRVALENLHGSLNAGFCRSGWTAIFGASANDLLTVERNETQGLIRVSMMLDLSVPNVVQMFSSVNLKKRSNWDSRFAKVEVQEQIENEAVSINSVECDEVSPSSFVSCLAGCTCSMGAVRRRLTFVDLPEYPQRGKRSFLILSWDKSGDSFIDMKNVPRQCLTSIMGTCRKASDLGKGSKEQTWVTKVSKIHPRNAWMPDWLLLQSVWASEVAWPQDMCEKFSRNDPKTQRRRRATMSK